MVKKKKKKENKKAPRFETSPSPYVLVYLDVKEIHYLNSFLKVSLLLGWQAGSAGKTAC